MENTGILIAAPGPLDYIAGMESGIVYEIRQASANWGAFLPTTERQSVPSSFDTMACTHFSCMNSVETQVNWLARNGKLNELQIAKLKAMGFYDENGNFNCSDRFNAIMGGNTVYGNYLYKPWEAARIFGLLPERDLPFGGNSWAEYHDPAVVTDAMKAKAKEALEILSIAWEWVFFDNDPNFNEPEFVSAYKGLKQAPLHITVPFPSVHAIMLHELTPGPHYKVFDTYPPFIFDDSNEFRGKIYCGIKGVVDVVKPEPAPVAPVKPAPAKPVRKYPQWVFNRDLYFGLKGDKDVKVLQQVLIAEGLLKKGLDTGNYFNITQQAVRSFQARYGIKVVGRCGPQTRAKLNQLCK